MPNFSTFALEDAINYLKDARRREQEVRRPQAGGEAAVFILLTWHTDASILIADGEFWQGPQAVQARVTLYSPTPGERPRTFIGEGAKRIRDSGETWGGQFGISQLGG